MINPFVTTVSGQCPGGFCDIIVKASDIIVVVLLVLAFLFGVTLIPPLFTWKSVKPDARKRIYFALFACAMFYLWLVVLGVHSVYCFGFVAHLGPCANKTYSTTPATVGDAPGTAAASSGASSITDGSGFKVPATGADVKKVGGLHAAAGSGATVLDLDPEDMVAEPEPFFNSSAVSGSQAEALVSECKKEADSSLKNISLVNVLILVVLVLTFAANINEVLGARALYHCETLCKKEDLQRFLSSLVGKRPEVGHLVKCFHTSKSADVKTNNLHKVVTYSTVQYFKYQTWKDFSDLRLIEPSAQYPVIEVEVSLNFFPGDHATADKYKLFVQKLTKEHSGRDNKISIDDYFHIEDHREWTFFIGNQGFIVPWWQQDPARTVLSCCFLIGWPFRMSYKGRVAKHKLEVKKAVFCETTSQDEGVSLTATPGSSMDSAEDKVEVEGGKTEDGDQEDAENGKQHVVDVQVSPPPTNSTSDPDLASPKATSAPAASVASPAARKEAAAPPPEAAIRTTQQMVDRSTPLLKQHHPGHHPLATSAGYPGGGHPLASAGATSHPLATSGHPLAANHTPPAAASAAAGNHVYAGAVGSNNSAARHPFTSPRTHIRESTKASDTDIVTAVTHHQDINGLNTVSTVALKDVDVQISALSGYETYV